MQNSNPTRILGIDPGSNITGFGVIDVIDNRLHHIESGCINIPKKDTFPNRLKYLYDKIAELIDIHSPSILAMEDSFVSKNAKSSLKLGQARGIVMLAAAKADVNVTEFPPTEVKIALTGFGHATKEQVSDLVKRRLNIKLTDKFDASDALAVA
ncbi:MAG: crossover junction endodeoxyribonuclease RuvC, partial [Pseudomonadota bacterium]